MDFFNEIERYKDKLKETIDKIDKKQINHFIEVLLKHYEAESHIFTFGNGGSGLTASHAVCDFNKGVCLDLEKKFKFICLNDNIGSILAYSNDISYDDILALQLKNYLNISCDLIFLCMRFIQQTIRQKNFFGIILKNGKISPASSKD